MPSNNNIPDYINSPSHSSTNKSSHVNRNNHKNSSFSTTAAREKHIDVIDQVLNSGGCLYTRLGVSKYADNSAIRRAYLTRSKICHPDRNNNHPMAKEASLSTAYKTLSCPSSRRTYDIYGCHVDANENTFSEAVAQVFHEFLDGQYDSLIAIIDYLQVLNPDIKINKDAARQVFSTMREYCLWGGKCWDSVKFEIIQLYELQQDLRSLSYFNILGRLKLSVALSKGFLLIPFSILEPSEANYGILQRILGKMIFILDRSEKKLQNLETCQMFTTFF